MQVDELAIRDVGVRAFRVPLNIALGTSVTVIRTVPLVLADLHTEDGVTGRAYCFAYAPSGAAAIAAHLVEAVDLVRGRRLRPQAIYDFLCRRLALIGVTGPVRMAVSLLDMALWDAAGQAAGKPVAALLGAELRPIPAYDSRGLGLIGPDALKAEAAAMQENGLKGIKLRLGYTTLREDIAAVHAVRRVIADDVKLMVDYNQALTTAEAIRRGLVLQRENLAWLEEPIRHDDYRGNAAIARALEIPLQIGENFNGPEAISDALALSAFDYAMPDVARIGGVTGWMRAAAIAGAAGIELSSHLMPEASIHLLAASPSAHWLEYVDWGDALVEQPLALADGAATPPDRPGFGFTWDEAKLKRLEAI